MVAVGSRHVDVRIVVMNGMNFPQNRHTMVNPMHPVADKLGKKQGHNKRTCNTDIKVLQQTVVFQIGPPDHAEQQGVIGKGFAIIRQHTKRQVIKPTPTDRQV